MFCRTEPDGLVVSVPLFIGRKRLIHHTLLKCTSGHVEEQTSVAAKPLTAEIGDIVWARAGGLQGWPGRVVHHSKKKMAEPPPGRVNNFLGIGAGQGGTLALIFTILQNSLLACDVMTNQTLYVVVL